MTDLRNRFAAMLDGEPAAPDDLDRVVAGGRRALRRRNTLTAVAGTAGTAAVTAAVVVPISLSNHGGTADHVEVMSQPTASPTPSPRCGVYYALAPRTNEKAYVKKLAHAHRDLVEVVGGRRTHGRQAITYETCPPGAKPDHPLGVTKPRPTTPPQPSYHYGADPRAIADGFAAELRKQVSERGFTIVYSRPFAQESSALEKGHPSYYDGNVDVQLPDGPANIGVQVTHETTELVPFDGSCDPSTCTQTKLPDGSVMQTSTVSSGGGGKVVVVEIHHPNGLIVEAQEANYAFGPEASRARTKNQPLTTEQLTELAQDPAFTF